MDGSPCLGKPLDHGYCFANNPDLANRKAEVRRREDTTRLEQSDRRSSFTIDFLVSVASTLCLGTVLLPLTIDLVTKPAEVTPLCTLLERKNITLSQLAKQSGVSASYVSYIVGGSKTPSLPTARRISKALNMSIDDLWRLLDK